jgi:hypothetical protein
VTEVPDFEALYRGESDPWQVASSFYEQRKLGLVLAALSRQRYRRAWDPAAGTGHLADRLAVRCDQVLATDLVPTAVRLAATTCAERPNVTLRRWAFPGDGRPDAESGFDLVVLSEFLYYLPAEQRAAIAGLLDEVTAPEAEVLSLHWRQQPHDAWLSGVAVQQELAEALQSTGWRLRYRIEDIGFDLAGWRRGEDDADDR